MHFAEFLNEGFLAHLRILSPPTCVGFSTDAYSLVRNFSWQCGSLEFDSSKDLSIYRLSAFQRRDLPLLQPTDFDAPNQSRAQAPSCVVPSSNGFVQYRNLNLLSIAYAFRLGLGPDLPRDDERCPGNLRLSVLKVSHFSFRYSYRHSHFILVQLSFRSTFVQV